MTDRELLELAAKAAGIKLHVWGTPGKENFADMNKVPFGGLWNPLNDDSDALRLAVKLDIDLMHSTNSEKPGQSVTFPLDGDYDCLTEWYTDMDKLAATRRAIVRAAAAIGAPAAPPARPPAAQPRHRQ